MILWLGDTFKPVTGDNREERAVSGCLTTVIVWSRTRIEIYFVRFYDVGKELEDYC